MCCYWGVADSHQADSNVCLPVFLVQHCLIMPEPSPAMLEHLTVSCAELAGSGANRHASTP